MSQSVAPKQREGQASSPELLDPVSPPQPEEPSSLPAADDEATSQQFEQVKTPAACHCCRVEVPSRDLIHLSAGSKRHSGPPSGPGLTPKCGGVWGSEPRLVHALPRNCIDDICFDAAGGGLLRRRQNRSHMKEHGVWISQKHRVTTPWSSPVLTVLLWSTRIGQHSRKTSVTG